MQANYTFIRETDLLSSIVFYPFSFSKYFRTPHYASSGTNPIERSRFIVRLCLRKFHFLIFDLLITRSKATIHVRGYTVTFALCECVCVCVEERDLSLIN